MHGTKQMTKISLPDVTDKSANGYRALAVHSYYHALRYRMKAKAFRAQGRLDRAATSFACARASVRGVRFWLSYSEECNATKE